jgi:hypothetical protein
VLRFLVDEDVDHRIIRGLLARLPDVDVVTVQEAGLDGRHDRDVLAWVAEQGRVLLTHDVTTMTRFAYERIDAALPMPGVFAVHQTAAIGPVIDDLVLLVVASDDGEWQGQVRYLPL